MSPKVYGPDKDQQRAIDVARRANDFLAEQVAKHADRFQGFAALPLQDPDAAAEELTRSVKELGFKGAMVNGFSQLTGKNPSYITIYPNTGLFGEW